jgi:hypothetical protein
MKQLKHPVSIFLLIVIALLVYSNWRTARVHGMTVPYCLSANIIPKAGCSARAWGNAVEVDCPDGAKIYYCNPLKQASPK